MRLSTIERAFQIARSGSVSSFTEIRRTLSGEGYGDVRAQLDGSFIRQQLNSLMHATQSGEDGPVLQPSRVPRPPAKTRPAVIDSLRSARS